MATRKVLEMNENGIHIICIKSEADQYSTYRIYRVWWAGGRHQKQIAKYTDFDSVLRALPFIDVYARPGRF